MNAKRPDLAKLTPPEKDALIRDLWRQVAAGQSEARVLRRRLGIAEAGEREGRERPAREAARGGAAAAGRAAGRDSP